MRSLFARVSIMVCLFVLGNVVFLHSQEDLTAQRQKAVLLEEYTGSGCGNCPDGAARASILKGIAQDRFYIMAIHAGHYAEPVAGYADYRTDFGEALLELAGNIGFPSGSINRHPYEGSALNMYRSSWTKATKSALEDTAAVNLTMTAVVDARTRRMQVDVRYCFTQEVTDRFMLLNVAVLQNAVVGRQNGAGSQYEHNHMLRHLLTGQWGDTLRSIEKGQVYSRQYEWELPDSVRNVPLDIRHLELLAFVTNSQCVDIENVCGAYPKIENLQEELNALVETVDLPDTRYGYEFLPVRVRNLCNDTIKSLAFSADVNSETHNVDVSVEIPPYQTREVNVHVGDFPMKSNNNRIALRLLSIQGHEVESEELVYTFFAPTAITGNKLYLELATDMCGDEIHCSLNNRQGNAIWSKGPFEAGVQSTIYDTIEIPGPGFYALELKDYWHDGWMDTPKGYYKLRDADGKLIAQNYSVEEAGDVFFFELKEDGTVSTEKPMDADRQALSVRAIEEGFEVVNPAGLELRSVCVFSLNGRCLYRQKLQVNGNASVRFCSAASQMYVVGIETKTGMVYRKMIRHQ